MQIKKKKIAILRKKMKKLINKTYKLSAAGNSFVFIFSGDNQKIKINKKSIIKFCSKSDGVGSDGLVILQKKKNLRYDYEWKFYNADASVAEMCGNAARCAAIFIKKYYKEKRDEFTLKTKAGIIALKVNGKNINVLMPKVDLKTDNLSLDIDKKTKVNLKFINSGVPHLVYLLENKKVNLNKSKEWIAKARKDTTFSEKGSNVTIYSLVGKNHIRAVTFERGVEDFTLACGTGAVAAAMAYANNKVGKKIKVDMPGGKLMVKTANRPILIGEAKFICEFNEVI